MFLTRQISMMWQELDFLYELSTFSFDRFCDIAKYSLLLEEKRRYQLV